MAGRTGTGNSARARWLIAPRGRSLEAHLIESLGVHPVVASLLVNRGVQDVAAARSFLRASVDDLHDPFQLPDMEAAVERVLAAISGREQVLVHGDYDVDGITATALLARFLYKLGLQVRHFVPHRFRDDYGVSFRALRDAAEQGVSLAITVDCGVSAVREFERARELGVDAVVLDHHELPPDAPRVPLVAPKRPDSQYPFSELSGVGLAYKLAAALCTRLGLSVDSLRRAFLDLVAVGTIADVVPLQDENRVLVRQGLPLLGKTRKAGLRALLDLCQVGGEPRVSDVAFRLAPRLNAAGRMADASTAVELLLTTDEEWARKAALHLEAMNRQRQREQQRMFEEALRLAEREVDLDEDRVVVLAAEGWHVGVVGIVASKLVEVFNRPAVLLGIEGDRARGSARSVAEFPIAEALEECDSLLIRHGGHDLAAGLAVSVERIGDLRERLNVLAAERLDLEELEPVVHVDRVVEASEVDLALVKALQDVAPFGEANAEPCLACLGLRVTDWRTVGRDDRHLRMTVEDNGSSFGCIGFGLGKRARALAEWGRVDICGMPERDEYSGQPRVQMRLEALRRAGS